MCFVGLKNNALEYYARSKSERSVVYATLRYATFYYWCGESLLLRSMDRYLCPRSEVIG